MERFLAAAVVLLAPMTARADFMPTCTRSAFAFVIDRSGSMTGQPLDSVKAATSAAVDKLGPNDCVGVIAFDSAPTTIVAMHPLGDPQAVKAAIARIQAGGGTEILGALDADLVDGERPLLPRGRSDRVHDGLRTRRGADARALVT